jgi:hypothetical protein
MLHAVARKTLLLTALIAFAAPTAFARDDIRTERVHFKPGASSATIKGKIKGYETVDYVLEASKGQQMNVSMATNNGANYFNILAPGENEVAMFIGSTSGNQFEGTLPESGDYKIRVYMMRSAARRGEVANYRLEMIVTGAAEKAATSAGASTADKMMARCRKRAASVLGVAGNAVNVKYEGQRIDHTHAVNGSASVRGQSETFQCSFDATGRQIVKFIVNEPQASSEGANPSSRRDMPSKDEQACLQADRDQQRRGDGSEHGTLGGRQSGCRWGRAQQGAVAVPCLRWRRCRSHVYDGRRCPLGLELRKGRWTHWHVNAPRLSSLRNRLFCPVCAGGGAFHRRHFRSLRKSVRTASWRLLDAFRLTLEPNARCLP